MAADHFFARWSRRKADPTGEAGTLPAEAPAGVAAPKAPADEPAKEPVPVTLADVDKLTADSDYSPFMARGVDQDIRRSALKKLFADPHYNVMDGLDIYIDDYNKFEPIPPAMLAALNHAKSVLNPLEHLKQQAMSMQESSPEPGAEQPPEDQEETVAAADETADGAEPDAETPDAGTDDPLPHGTDAEHAAPASPEPDPSQHSQASP